MQRVPLRSQSLGPARWLGRLWGGDLGTVFGLWVLPSPTQSSPTLWAWLNEALRCGLSSPPAVPMGRVSRASAWPWFVSLPLCHMNVLPHSPAGVFCCFQMTFMSLAAAVLLGF